LTDDDDEGKKEAGAKGDPLMFHNPQFTRLLTIGSIPAPSVCGTSKSHYKLAASSTKMKMQGKG